MTIYYKATRPDGTDFRTGTINYAAALESGEIIRHPAVRRVKDDPSTYLSVSIAPADCTGMEWPCRLFEVKPVGLTIRATDLPNKRGCSALRVVRELPAWQALGPNGQEVVALIERCRTITSEQARQLAVVWGCGVDVAWSVARSAARSAAWSAAWSAAAGTVTWGTDATGNAAGALVVRDLITPEQFALFYGPWASVMEVK